MSEIYESYSKDTHKGIWNIPRLSFGRKNTYLKKIMIIIGLIIKHKCDIFEIVFSVSIFFLCKYILWLLYDHG